MEIKTYINCFIQPSFFKRSNNLKNCSYLRGINSRVLSISLNQNKKPEEKKKLEAEKVFFEGGPSKLELLIPFISILTVIGIIPFIASLARQFWVRYKITNRRISVDSGFGGDSRVEIVYRDIKEINHISRFGGEIADVVLILKDEAQLELRSLPNWEENIEFIRNNMKIDNKSP